MQLYHVSSSILNIGDVLQCNHLDLKRFISPFVLAARAGEDVFIATQCAARYSDERTKAIAGDGVSQKMATEGIFEFVRCEKFSTMCPRYNSLYLFDGIDCCRAFATEFRKGVRSFIYTVEVQDSEIRKHDMNLYTQADSLIVNSYKKSEKKFEQAIKLAESYWAGKIAENSIIECLLGRNALVTSIVETIEQAV